MTFLEALKTSLRLRRRSWNPELAIGWSAATRQWHVESTGACRKMPYTPSPDQLLAEDWEPLS